MEKYVSIIFLLAFLLAIGAVLLLVFYRPKRKGLSITSFNQSLAKIENMIKGGSELEIRQAVIESDKLLDAILKEKVTGENLGSRLKAAKYIFKDRDLYNQIWEVHKLRNKLVHEVGYNLSVADGRGAVKVFKKAFRSLGYY